LPGELSKREPRNALPIATGLAIAL